ncbi:MAG: hypothetical protein K8F24_12165, partial [Bacteroidales bacterium]|nr:hypothetical protein [Bacteroidales bacterium]
MKNNINEPDGTRLTSRMDVGTKEFHDFQVLLLKKSRERTEIQKKKIALLDIKYQMEDYVNSPDSELRTAGEFLKYILKTLSIQQNRFAKYIGLEPSNLSKLINGERSINYNLALIFGSLFNHNPMLWIEIQAKNEIENLLHSDKAKY